MEPEAAKPLAEMIESDLAAFAGPGWDIAQFPSYSLFRHVAEEAGLELEDLEEMAGEHGLAISTDEETNSYVFTRKEANG